MSADEIDKHYLKFERPHVYECTCGVVAFSHPKTYILSLSTLPPNIKYLECGHAKCAATVSGCIICRLNGP